MSQPNKIRLGGWPEVQRKAKFFFWILLKFPFQLICFLPALLIVLTIRLLRPVFLIRFEAFVSWRIGHFTGNLELYLCELDAGINKPEINFLDIWYHPACPPSNFQLARMWRRKLHIGPSMLFGLVNIINDIIPRGCIHKIGLPTMVDRDVHNLLELFPPHLSFLPDEERRGQMGLRSLGIPDGKRFICLAVRDSSYLADQSPHIDWSHHNYRDCDIQNYILAAQELTEKGYFVIRVGAVVKEKMAVDNPMIIDYATNGLRSDFMDIYLGAKCMFCISNNMGFDGVPIIFRRPIVYVDTPQLKAIRTENSDSLSIIKGHWKRDEGRFMTFIEIFQSGADRFEESSEFSSLGIDLIESKPEEIKALVIEMEDRLNGKWKVTKEDEELQEKFWRIFKENVSTDPQYHGEIKSSIGAEFLKRNQRWLELI
jgi:putative glycosyltransferase (TIGR04372 family)